MADHIAPWLEMELARQLEAVPAPESLWERIQEPPVPQPERSFRWELWPVAAALLLMASAELIWQAAARDPLAEMEKLAVQELHRSGDLDIRSEDPSEIRTWLKTKANIDIALPYGAAARLLGARLIRRWGTPVAAVAYRVGDDDATLLVSREYTLFKGTAASKHVFARIGSNGGASVYSWRTPEQVYTIASSMTGNSQAACALCHARAVTTLN